MAMKRRAKSIKVYPETVTHDHAKIIGKAHRLDVLRALAAAPDGLTFSYLAFKIVGTSGTNVILSELGESGLATQDKKTDLYRVTSDGRKALALGESLLALGGGSSGNGGGGVRA